MDSTQEIVCPALRFFASVKYIYDLFNTCSCTSICPYYLIVLSNIFIVRATQNTKGGKCEDFSVLYQTDKTYFQI